MADDPKKRASPDNKRISLSEPHEVRYWTKKLGVTQTRLRSAVNSVGSSAVRVRKYLEGK